MEEAFLQLVRLGIGHSAYLTPEQVLDWDAIEALAMQHGLLGVIVDGIDNLREEQRPPKVAKLRWIGETLQGYEQRYESYRRAIAEMAAFYNSHGFKMMVLKGYACSLDWPNPEHRPCGDIDIWLFGKQKEADAAMAKEKGVEIDKGHHHHTVFNWMDFSVENHYDFISVYHHKSHARLEKLFKGLGTDDSHVVEIFGEKVYLPSPNLHALFLLKHTMLHFVSGEINLRQIIDWGFFVAKHGKEVDWTWLMGVLEEYGMLPAFNIFNAICVEDLGFETNLFPLAHFSPIVKDCSLREILHAESTKNAPKEFFANLRYRYRRWKGSAWKHELCYKESMTSAFWYGVWGHIIKPKTIEYRTYITIKTIHG